MRYVKVNWHHDFDEEPITYFHEVGDDNYETAESSSTATGTENGQTTTTKQLPRD
ncbi:hypothetical protein F5X71_27705 [Nocardia brasiliensis]|uniref:DUF6881 domain-containing protein n=1 Tax=Nocardia brasiliensis TaxID=37326 RepID=A0A6G9XXC9_NOCBR|nr:hypothetical protein [Nocardia brasiliensis]QIS05592.1 hypothetical protein F5X71_27705 [Nocardia brasiliensis]